MSTPCAHVLHYNLRLGLQSVRAEPRLAPRDALPVPCRALALGARVVCRVRGAVESELGYTCSAGVAHNKLLAKLVAGMHKPRQHVGGTAAAGHGWDLGALGRCRVGGWGSGCCATQSAHRLTGQHVSTGNACTVSICCRTSRLLMHILGSLPFRILHVGSVAVLQIFRLPGR